MEFFRQEYWSGLPFPPPGNLPNSGIKPVSPEAPVLAGWFLTLSQVDWIRFKKEPQFKMRWEKCWKTKGSFWDCSKLGSRTDIGGGSRATDSVIWVGTVITVQTDMQICHSPLTPVPQALTSRTAHLEMHPPLLIITWALRWKRHHRQISRMSPQRRTTKSFRGEPNSEKWSTNLNKT